MEVVAGADPDTPVPTCPLWTVRNVLSHVAGIPADILAGNVDGAATDPWTAAQVEARRELSIEEICSEWHETGPRIDGMIDGFGRTGEQLLVDLTTHEFDVRHALGKPGPKDLAVWDIGVDFGAAMVLDAAVAARGLEPMAVRVGDRSWRLGGEGEGDVRTTLSTTAFELVRALTGRRSRAQVAALDWSADPAPYLVAFEDGIFRFATTDIVE